MSEQGGCPWKQVASFTSLKPVFSKAQSAVPRQIQGPLLPQCAQQPVLTAAPSVGVPRTKTDAVREATRGAVQDARQIIPKKPSLFVLMLFRWWGWVMTDAMGREFTCIPTSRYSTDQVNHPQKTTYFFKNKSILCIGVGGGEDDAKENLGQIINSPAFQEKELSPLPLASLWQSPKLQLGKSCPCNTESGGVFLFLFLFLRDVVVSIGLFLK